MYHSRRIFNVVVSTWFIFVLGNGLEYDRLDLLMINVKFEFENWARERRT